MSTRTTICIALACLIPLSVAGPLRAAEPEAAALASTGPWSGATSEQAGVAAALAELPVAFEQNVGQSDERVAFITRGTGYTLFLTHDEAVFALRRATEPEAERAPGELEPGDKLAQLERAEVATSVLRMRLVGATATAPVGEAELETRTNYFLGDDPAGWHTDVANFGRVRYPDVYPGVDLVYYGNRGVLEYDFVVAPGADPSAIEVEWDGAESIEVDDAGALVLRVGGGEVRQAAPVLYQETESGRAPVTGRFVVGWDGRVRFDVGAYDPRLPLVIDPTLVYSSFLGGIGSEYAQDVAVDASGAAFVLMQARSSNFPAVNGYDSTNDSSGDVLVVKLSPAGNAVVYATYLGGTFVDYPNGIAVDPSGGACITGSTRSTDFPMVNAFDSTFNGGNNDAFAAYLGPAGNVLTHSTYIGGSGNEIAHSVAQEDDKIYIAGATGSPNFPITAGAFDQSFGGTGDGFVACLTFVPGSINRVWCTFLGGTNWDAAVAVAVRDGEVYVTGRTESADFPTFNAYDPTFNGGYFAVDAFVTKLNSSGNGIFYSTFLGGADDYDEGVDIAVDAAGAAYVTGYTFSIDFPAVNAFDPTFNGVDSFVTKLSPGGSSLVYSTALGGSYSDYTEGIDVDAAGAAYVTGWTYSPDFPVVAAYDSTLDENDAFVTKLSPTGGALVYSTYLGGTSDDGGHAIAVDSLASVYVVGGTWSTNFPVLNAYDPSFNGGSLGNVTDGFVAKLATAADVRGTMSATPNPIGWNENLTYRITATNLGPATATGVRVTMPTPAQTTFVSVSTTQGSPDFWPFPGSTGTVAVDVGTLAPNASATVTIVVKVRIRSTGSIVGQATLTSTSDDPSSTNNTPTRTTPIG